MQLLQNCLCYMVAVGLMNIQILLQKIKNCILGVSQCRRGCAYLLQWQGFIQPLSGDDEEWAEQDGWLLSTLLPHWTSMYPIRACVRILGRRKGLNRNYFYNEDGRLVFSINVSTTQALGSFFISDYSCIEVYSTIYNIKGWLIKCTLQTKS